MPIPYVSFKVNKLHNIKEKINFPQNRLLLVLMRVRTLYKFLKHLLLFTSVRLHFLQYNRSK